jgi:NDP-sugar pyrophosphorylase family protein
LPDDELSFLLFPVSHPEFFDAVRTTADGCVLEIQVKQQNAGSNWIWGAFKMPGAILHELYSFWVERDCRDEYIGTLINAWLARGGHAVGIRAGESYVDVGTLNGYREAMNLLCRGRWSASAPPANAFADSTGTAPPVIA